MKREVKVKFHLCHYLFFFIKEFEGITVQGMEAS